MNSKDWTGQSYRASPSSCLPHACQRDKWKVVGLIHSLARAEGGCSVLRDQKEQLSLVVQKPFGSFLDFFAEK